MVKAIVMAGGKVKRNLKDYERLKYNKIYNEDYLLGKGYKPLKRVKIGSGAEKNPLISYVLSALDNVQDIEDITIVGERDRINKFLSTTKYKKDIKVIQQVGSLLENGLEGYNASGAKNHALIIASDLPQITSFTIEDFLGRCSGSYDMYYPIIGWEVGKITDQRKPLKLLDDKDDNEDKIFDKKGRRGFRVGNMMYVNPDEVYNKEFGDLAYSLRKLRYWKNIIGASKYVLFDAIKYFMGWLSVTDVEKSMSRLFGTKFKLVELYRSDAEEDIDSEEDIQNLESKIVS